MHWLLFFTHMLYRATSVRKVGPILPVSALRDAFVRLRFSKEIGPHFVTPSVSSRSHSAA